MAFNSRYHTGKNAQVGGSKRKFIICTAVDLKIN